MMRPVEQSGAGMVVVNMLAAYLSDRVDSHKDRPVRRLLTTLGAAAARSGTSVVLVRHHTKAAGGPAMYRGGPIGIVGAARAAYAVVRDPDDTGHRLLATVKCNLDVEALTWGYSWADVPHLGVARIEWDAGPDPRNASELLAAAQSSSLSEAANWPSAWRSGHPGPVLAAELLATAEEVGIARTTTSTGLASSWASGRPRRARVGCSHDDEAVGPGLSA